MAIIEQLGLEVKVQVNGFAGTEYTDEEPEVLGDACSQSTTACHRYVESVDSAEFAIYVSLIPGINTAQEWVSRSPDHKLLFAVAFDGGHCVTPKFVSENHVSALFEGIYNYENQTLSKFRFARVATVDDADEKCAPADMKITGNMGLIRVVVRRCVLKSVAEYEIRPTRGLEFGTSDLPLPEKALKGKAISHLTALSAPVKSIRKSNEMTCDIEYEESNECPFAIFYFKYRSKEALRQELVITRSDRLSAQPDLESLPLDDSRRFACEMMRIKDGKKRAVSVKDEEDITPLEPARAFKYVRIEGGKRAIDLTEEV